MVIFGQVGLRPARGPLRAGELDRRRGSTKTRKASARLLLQVSEGSKVIVPFDVLACRFMFLRIGVSERRSGGLLGPSGFHFGDIDLSFDSAVWAQSWGFIQLIDLSALQSLQVQ